MGIRCARLRSCLGTRTTERVPLFNAFLSKRGVCAGRLSTGKVVIVKGRKGKVHPRVRGLVGRGLCVPDFPPRERASRSLGMTVTATIVYTRFHHYRKGTTRWRCAGEQAHFDGAYGALAFRNVYRLFSQRRIGDTLFPHLAQGCGEYIEVEVLVAPLILLRPYIGHKGECGSRSTIVRLHAHGFPFRERGSNRCTIVVRLSVIRPMRLSPVSVVKDSPTRGAFCSTISVFATSRSFTVSIEQPWLCFVEFGLSGWAL